MKIPHPLVIITFLTMMALTGHAKVKWIDTTHDFGAFSEDLGMVDTEFRMLNEGDRPVRILDARATCGCTVPKFDRTDIAPGDTTVLRVSYNASGRPGKFEKYVYVKTSDSPQEQRTLTVKGVVIGASATIRSRYPIDGGALQLQTDVAGFGEVKRGKAKTIFIGMYNRSETAVTPTLIGVPDFITPQFVPGELPPGQQGQLSLTINTLKMNEWGINEGDFKLMCGDNTVTIKYFAIVMEDFDTLTPGQMLNAPIIGVTPSKIDLGICQAGSGLRTEEFEVENTGKSPLIIRRVQTVDPSLVAAVISSDKIKPGKKAKLKVTFDPSKAENDFVNARISIINNDPTNPMAVVRLTAEITE